MSWTIRADFGSGLTQISTQHVEDIQRERHIHHNLKTSIDMCTFHITEESLALSFQSSTVDIPVEIDRDGAAFFRGIVRPNHSRNFAAKIKRMKIEAVDYHYELQKKITSTFSFSNLPISDSSNTSHSFLHQLFARAGIDSAKLTFSDVSTQITEIAVDESDDTTYWKLLNEVLWEYGYVTYQLPNGNFEVYNLYPTSISFGTLTDDEVYHGANETRREYRYERVRVEYSPIETISGVTLWRETKNQGSNNDCNIDLSAGEYYPANCNDQTAYAKYKLTDYEVIRGENLTFNTSLSGVTVNTFNPLARRAEICLFSSGGGTITQLRIDGDAVVRDTTQTYRAVRVITAGSENILDYTSKYLDTEAKAQRLASGLAEHYTDSIYTYKFQTFTDLVPGAYYTLDSTAMGITVDTRVLSAKENRIGEIVVMLEAVAPVTITTDVSEADFAPAENEPTQQNKQSDAQQPTFNNLEEGLKDDGTNLYVAGTVITGQGIKSDNYTSGSQGWAIDGAGDAEFNNVTVRGTVEADAGSVGGWEITASTIEDTAGTVVLNNSTTAFEILDSGGNYKIILGYFGNAPAGWTDPDGNQLTSTEYGLYVSGGDFTVADGAKFENGNYLINSDAAYRVKTPEGEDIIVLGALGGGDIGLDIGGVKFTTDVAGGGGANTTMTTDVQGGGGATSIMSNLVIGGGGALLGTDGLLYSLQDNELTISGKTIIDDTLSADSITTSGRIESAFSPGNNYWDLSSGDWRIGNDGNFLDFDATAGNLTVSLDALFVSSLETNVSGDLAISSETGVLPEDVRTNSQPIEIGTEDADDPTYGYLNHAQSLKLQTGGVDRLIADSIGNIGIGTTVPSYLLEVNGNAAINSGLSWHKKMNLWRLFLNYSYSTWSSILRNFSSPSSSPRALTTDGNNLISSDNSTDTIYVHDGISSTILNSFSSPGSALTGLTFDGTNLVSSDAGTNTIYIHDGISSNILNSFSSPGTTPQGLATDGTNLISTSFDTSTIYVHDGFTSTTTSSFSSSGSDLIGGLVFDGINLLSGDNANADVYIYSGISSNVIQTLSFSNIIAIGFDGNNLITANNSSDTINVHGDKWDT